MSQQWEYRAYVDGLRAIAILLVLGFHAFPLAVPGGFVGVDVFFVISGYLITGIILSGLTAGRFSLGRFYAARIRRLLPAVVLVLASCLAFGWWTLLSVDYADLGRHTAGAAAFASNVVLWYQTNYFDREAELKPLLHLWSLGVEQQFYLWWPPIALVAWRTGWSISLPLMLVGAITLAASILFTPGHPAGAFYLPVTRMWELLIGGGVAYAELVRPRLLSAITERAAIRELASIGGVVLVAVSAFTIAGTADFPGWLALLPTLGTALVIVAGPATFVSRTLLAQPAMVFIGLISFPLYLWHWPLLVFGRLLSVNESTALTWTLLSVSVALATATYLAVERPLRTRTRPSGAQAMSLLGLLALVGVAGWLTMARDGFPARHSEFDPHALKTPVGQYRIGTCYRDPATDTPEYPAECNENTGRRSLLLFGDSHAAQLYSNLVGPVRDRNFDLVQYTVLGCRPTTLDPAYCVEFNAHVRELVRSRKPTVALVAASWRPSDADLMAGLVRDLSSTGAKVMIVGPPPLWAGQPLLAVKLTNAAKQGGLLVRQIDPDASISAQPVGFDDTRAPLDAALSDAVKHTNADYFSAYRVLCPGGRCLATTDGTLRGLMYFDRHHLTEAGAKFLVDRLFAESRLPALMTQ